MVHPRRLEVDEVTTSLLLLQDNPFPAGKHKDFRGQTVTPIRHFHGGTGCGSTRKPFLASRASFSSSESPGAYSAPAVFDQRVPSGKGASVLVEAVRLDRDSFPKTRSDVAHRPTSALVQTRRSRRHRRTTSCAIEHVSTTSADVGRNDLPMRDPQLSSPPSIQTMVPDTFFFPPTSGRSAREISSER